jgi:hypothetical protein
MIGNLEINGRSALVFDTGLSAKAFAQAKLTYFVTEKGFIVQPDGAVSEWHPDGVLELKGNMAVWGPAFAGRPLLSLIADRPADTVQRDRALNALRCWISACVSLTCHGIQPALAPAASFIADSGAVLFSPTQTARRSLEAEDCWITDAERWMHPDLHGEEAITFTAATMLYRIFAGDPPFPSADVATLHQDMREKVCIPLRLAVPGLNAELAALVMSALIAANGSKRPKLTRLRDFLGDSAPADSYIQPVSAEKSAKIALERAQFQKKSALIVKTKRFIGRNTTLLAIALAAVVGVVLIVRSVINDRANRPTTKGMTPITVTETFYGAFGSMDHQLMDVCVLKNVARADIELVTNFFVLSRVRQTYEATQIVIPAQEWVDAGSPPIETAIFGVSGLTITPLDDDESDGEMVCEAAYTLWLPGGYRPQAPEEPERDPYAEAADPLPPWGIPRVDTVRLTWNKDSWRIAEIARDDDME